MQTEDQTASPSADEIQRIYRRTLRILVTSQMLAGLGLAAGVAVGALLAEDMLDSTSLSGLPSALLTLGSAVAALLVGRVSQRLGRRVGLSMGYLAATIGGAGVILAAIIESPILLFLALFLYGSGTATNLQARYAGTDLVGPERRGQAVSTVLVATTFGAVVGPNLIGVMGDLAIDWGIPELSGPFVLSTAAYAVAGTVLFILLRPDPLLVARQAAAQKPAVSNSATASVDTRTSQRRGIALGATVMIIAQMVMVGIMTMTPIHMRHHGHGLTATGLVIAVHVAGMYLPSPFTGYLIDRIGRVPVMAAAGIILPASGLIAAFAPVDSVPIIAVALGLLGLGWNFGLVSGTAMVTDATPLERRASTQGTVDLCVSLSGASGGIMSGVVVATTSYTVLGLAGGVLALALVPVVVMTQTTQPTARGDRAAA